MKKVFIRYNQISHLSDDYQELIRHVSNFYQQLPFDHDFVEVDSTDLDQTFADLESVNPDWVVVVSYGHCTQNRNLYNDLIDHAVQTGSPLVGHIMNFSDQFPHLHPQLFAVNYQVWRQIGQPNWNYDGSRQTVIYSQYQPSAETFHDSYTPVYLESLRLPAMSEFPEVQIAGKVIARLLMHGYTVQNVPHNLRKQKFHLYPDQESDHFHAFVSGKPYQGNHAAQRQYAELIGHLDRQVQRQYYVLNTEPLTQIPAGEHITHYMGVASGLKLMCTMIKNGYDHNTQVTVFDFSDIALEFQKFLVANWNGDFSQYQMLCKVFENSTPGHFPCLPSGAWQDSYDYLLNQLNLSPAEFQHHWQQYKRLKINFQKINLYDPADQHRVADICAQHDTTYLWVSNAFYMEYSLIKLGMRQLKSVRDSFFQELEQSGAHVILDTNDFWAQSLITFN